MHLSCWKFYIYIHTAFIQTVFCICKVFCKMIPLWSGFPWRCEIVLCLVNGMSDGQTLTKSRYNVVASLHSFLNVHSIYRLSPSLKATGDRQQVAALHEWLQAKQWLIPGVQFLRLIQPLPPGGGLMDLVGANCQWMGGCAQEEREAA